MVKRLLSTAIGIIILILVFFYHNSVIINIATTVVALIGLSEFYNVFKKKGYKPIEMLRIYSYTCYTRNWFKCRNN